MTEEPKKNPFAEAGEQRPVSLPREMLEMLKHNKKWWLLPILFVLLLFAALLVLSTTSAAPFIYTLF